MIRNHSTLLGQKMSLIFGTYSNGLLSRSRVDELMGIVVTTDKTLVTVYTPVILGSPLGPSIKDTADHDPAVPTSYELKYKSHATKEQVFQQHNALATIIDENDFVELKAEGGSTVILGYNRTDPLTILRHALDKQIVQEFEFIDEAQVPKLPRGLRKKFFNDIMNIPLNSQ